jgi:hypothetical protein
MATKIAGVVILLLSTLFLPACTFLRSTGPCYGYGCHGFAPIPSGPVTVAVPKAHHGKAMAKTSKAAPQQTKQGN